MYQAVVPHANQFFRAQKTVVFCTSTVVPLWLLLACVAFICDKCKVIIKTSLAMANNNHQKQTTPLTISGGFYCR